MLFIFGWGKPKTKKIKTGQGKIKAVEYKYDNRVWKDSKDNGFTPPLLDPHDYATPESTFYFKLEGEKELLPVFYRGSSSKKDDSGRPIPGGMPSSHIKAPDRDATKHFPIPKKIVAIKVARVGRKERDERKEFKVNNRKDFREVSLKAADLLEGGRSVVMNWVYDKGKIQVDFSNDLRISWGGNKISSGGPRKEDMKIERIYLPVKD